MWNYMGARQDAVISPRYSTPDGRTVEVVTLHGIQNHRNGEWLRVCHFGYYIDTRRVEDLERYLRLADLEESLAAGCSR
jgi:hypothetical protein